MHGQPRRVMVFGDSNTVGTVYPETGAGQRLMGDSRWPTAMRAALDGTIELFEEGLNSRTTDLDDNATAITGAACNGLSHFPAAMAAHQPLDACVIMLGTNDLKIKFRRSPERIVEGMRSLVRLATGSRSKIGYAPPRVLLICPPALAAIAATGRFREAFDETSIATSRLLSPLARTMAEREGAHFFDANEAISTDGVDGVHFTGESHRRLGQAVATRLRAILEL